jgi:hypothetical protein
MCRQKSLQFACEVTYRLALYYLLLLKLASSFAYSQATNFGLSSGYVSWFHSYLTNRQSSARIYGSLSFLYVVKSGVPQGSTLGPLLFNIFINYISDCTFNSKYLVFAYDVKIYHSINNVHDCKLLQSDINSV